MNMVELREVAEFINGYAFKPADWNGRGKRIIRIQNLTDDSKPYNYSDIDVPNKYTVRKGNLLVSWSATLDVFEWNSDDEALLNQHIFKVEFKHDGIEKRYFKYILKDAVNRMKKFTHGSTMKHIVREDFVKTRIPLPSLSEQKRIADILDKADSLRQKRKKSITLLDELLKSVFIDMFGDPVRNEKGWEVRRIGDSIVETNSINPKGLPEHIFEYIDISSVNNKHKIIDEFQVVNGREAPSRARQVVMLEDIIVSTVRPNLNAVAMIKQNYRRALASTGFCVLRPNRIKISPYYLFQICKHDYFVSALSKIAKGASYPAVSNNDVKNVKIILPPIKKQILFENVVKRIESTNNSFSKSLSDMEHQFNALLQRAFRGEGGVKGKSPRPIFEKGKVF